MSYPERAVTIPVHDACSRCGTTLRYVARRTVRVGVIPYYLHVRVCPTCGCAYGDAEPVHQPAEPVTPV
jgi:uncharacterized protein with PIN domain